MISLGVGVEFECSNGGIVQMVGKTDDLNECGIEDGWAFYGDLYINPYSDVTLDITGGYGVEGSVKHMTGDPIITFNLSGRSPNTKTDIRAENLKPESWYRLQFSGNLVETAGGMSHGQTDNRGVIQYMEANIPNG